MSIDSYLFLIPLQETIAKAIEEKISGEQRRYLLNEQLKAIKKVSFTKFFF